MAIEVIPENFLARILSYFGLTASSLLLLSGVFLSQSGLGSVVNPAMWIVSAVFALLFAYSIRTYISRHFLAVLVLAVLCYFCFVYGYVYYGSSLVSSLSQAIDPQLISLSTSFVSLFVPCTLFSITLVSHKKHELLVKDDLPDRIRNAVNEQVIVNPIYYKSFDVDANIEYRESSPEGKVRIDLTVAMVIVNRSGKQFQVPHRYARSTGHFRLNKLIVNGMARDISDPSMQHGDGFRSTDSIEPKSEMTIVASLTEFFSHDDVQLYSCFDCSAESFTLKVSNLSPSELGIHIQNNNNDNATSRRDGSVLSWQSESALLPNQGARLAWQIRSNGD